MPALDQHLGEAAAHEARGASNQCSHDHSLCSGMGVCPIDEGVDDLIAAWLREQEMLGVEGDPATAFAESCLQQAAIARVVGESVAAGLEDQHGYVEIGDSVPQIAQHAVDL